MIKIIDTNHDNVVSLRELAEWIEKVDDKDGFVSLNEYYVSMGLDGVCVCVCVCVCWLVVSE